MKIMLQRTVHGLRACDDTGTDMLRKIKVGALVSAEIRRPRNLAHHKRFWLLLTTVWQACGQWPTPEALLVDLKFRLRHTDDVLLVSTGEIVRIPRSISFGEMDQAEFDAFYQRALTELCAMAGGIDEPALRDAVLDQLRAA